MNYADPLGNSPDSIWKTLLGVIFGIGLAAVAIGGLIASGGALLAPVLIGAGIGAAVNLVSQGAANLMAGEDFFDDINWWNVGLGALSGAAFATGIGGLGGAFAIGAVSNAGMSAFEQKSWANIGFSAVIGGLSAAVGYGAGKFLSNKLINVNTNLSFSNYRQMAMVDGARFGARNYVALMSKVYTMGPTFATGATRSAIKTIGNKIGGWLE